MKKQIIDELSPAELKALGTATRAPGAHTTTHAGDEASWASQGYAGEGKNMSAWTTTELIRMLNTVHEQTLAGEKASALVFGEGGIGKTQIVQGFAKNIARTYKTPARGNREYLYIDDIKDIAKRDEVIQNPEKYYVFLDITASQLQVETTSGIPDVPQMQKRGYVFFCPPDWVALITNPKFAGFIFLDEVNRAHESVINTLYKFIQDRVISGRTMSKNVMLIAAANLGSHMEGLVRMDKPLLSRFSVGVLIATPEEWFKWAESENIDPLIIDYVRLNPKKNFISPPTTVEEAIPVNPRSIHAADKNIKAMYAVYDNAIAAAKADGVQAPELNPELLKQYIPHVPGYEQLDIKQVTGNVYSDLLAAVKVRCGTEWANGFVKYVMQVHAFDWADIMKKAAKKHWKPSGKHNTISGASGESQEHMYALQRFFTDTILGRYHKARITSDVAEKNKIAQEIATMMMATHPEVIAFILDKIWKDIRYHKEIDPVQASKDVVGLLSGIAGAIGTADPELKVTIQNFLNLLGKARKGDTLTESEAKSLKGSLWYESNKSSIKIEKLTFKKFFKQRY